MKKYLFAIVFEIVASAAFLNAQDGPKEKGLEAITLETIRGQLGFLSSDWMEGRSTGDKGYYLASEYVASMFRVFGATGAGDSEVGRGSGRMAFMSPGGPGGQDRQQFTPPKSYFQDFNLIENIPGGSSSLTIRKSGSEFAFEEGIDFRILRGSENTKFDAPVVFVGYGIVDKEKGIDDFAGIDVKGKVILRLSGFPGQNDQNSPMYKKFAGDNPRNAFEMMRSKNTNINNRGILGVIDITDLTFTADLAKRWGTSRFENNLSPAENTGRGSRVDLNLDSREVALSPVNISVTQKILSLLLKDSGLDLAKYEKDAAAGVIKSKPLIIPGVTLSMNIATKSRRVNVRNVVAMIEGENKNEIVVTGAHLDHLGTANGLIWNGADDNASGVVAVMTIAKAFAASGVKPKRTIVFCAWTGEEQGLLGSKYYTQYPTVGKISDVKFYLNFDMIARDAATDTAKNMAGFTYTKAYPKLEEITKANLAQYKINLKVNIRSEEAPRGGSDFTAFAENKIPIIEWMAAMHQDYHRPSDNVDAVNWNKMLNIIKMGYLQLWDIVNGEIK